MLSVRLDIPNVSLVVNFDMPKRLERRFVHAPCF